MLFSKIEEVIVDLDGVIRPANFAAGTVCELFLYPVSNVISDSSGN
jgi:hypothetical protein